MDVEARSSVGYYSTVLPFLAISKTASCLMTKFANCKTLVLMEIETENCAEKSEQCNNGFSCDQNENRSQHLDNVSQTPVLTGHNAKLYKCEQCDAAFTRPYHLVTHNRKHTGERPFVCAVCGKTFTQRSNLTTHTKLHTGVKTFQCNTCSKVFSRKYHLIRHSETHTKEGYDAATCRGRSLETKKSGTLGSNMVNNCRDSLASEPQMNKQLTKKGDSRMENQLNMCRESVLRFVHQEPDHRKTENRLLKPHVEFRFCYEDEGGEMQTKISENSTSGCEYRNCLDDTNEADKDNDVKTLQCKRCLQYLSLKDFTTHFITCTCTCAQDEGTCVSCDVNAADESVLRGDVIPFSNHGRMGDEKLKDFPPEELIYPRSFFRCDECWQTFSSQSDLWQHGFATHHTSGNSVSGRCASMNDGCKDPHCSCDISDIGSPTW